MSEREPKEIQAARNLLQLLEAGLFQQQVSRQQGNYLMGVSNIDWKLISALKRFVAPFDDPELKRLFGVSVPVMPKTTSPNPA